MFPKDFDVKSAIKVDGVKVIPFEKINLASITNDNLKASIKVSLEKKQVISVKKFLGFEVKSLYDFFMLFVVMAGIASVILFFLSKKLVDMMHD